MSIIGYSNLSLPELARGVAHQEITAEELVRLSADRIERTQPALNAFVTYDIESALKQAQCIDEGIRRGQYYGPLQGIPLAIKDNVHTIDFPTSAASRVQSEHDRHGDATVVACLRQAGAIIIGKTNMHEWAYGATNSESAYGACRNPWNPAHISGGSSGGSAVAVAAGMIPAAIGSDTGGSVRIPSSACGISGIKPTYGAVSRFGVLPLSWSFDCVGPMARSAEDLALLLEVISVRDEKDASCTGQLKRSRSTGKRGLAGRRFGVLRGEGFETSDEVADCLEEAYALLRHEGAQLVDVNLPKMGSGFAMWKVIMFAEASAYHAAHLEQKSALYSRGVRSQLEAGYALSAVEYLQAQQFRAVFNREVMARVNQYDAILMPTLPVTAPLASLSHVMRGGREITVQDAMTCLPWLANLTGLPALSVPCGFGENGMPIGLTIMGKPWSDFELLDLGQTYQALTTWHKASSQTALTVLD